jgi:cob(I)alamin adenosyltransferase
MSQIYNRTGDDGSTGLLGEGRLPKYHPRIDTLGCIDEASAALGLARAMTTMHETGHVIKEVQRDLYAIMAEIAATAENIDHFQNLTADRIKWLETQVDDFSSRASAPSEFILPGDTVPGGALDLARAMVRKAERRVAKLISTGEISNMLLLQYLNRLSSLCFALEIFENAQAGEKPSLAKEK